MVNVIKEAGKGAQLLSILGTIFFSVIIWLMIYGNLSGNLGFGAGTTGYNNTENVINNATGGFLSFSNLANTLFIIVGIVLLISMLIGLLALVVMITRMYSSGKGKFSGY